MTTKETFDFMMYLREKADESYRDMCHAMPKFSHRMEGLSEFAYENGKYDAYWDVIHEFEKYMVDNAPTIDAQPIIHGKWLNYDDTERFTACCSVCGNWIDTRFGKKYCPNCGAKNG